MQPLGENTANTPAFLGKLWKMVNDPSTDHLICWSPSGTSFVIPNQAQFWYELLPLYYKHNNMSSFVRQLNMYGFHKLSTVENGTMDSDKDEIQFSHPFFLRDQPELLRNIKRKVCMSRRTKSICTEIDSQATTSKASNENANKHDELSKVLNDVKQLRGRQASVDSQLNAMKQENALLWREVAILRQKHLKQQKIVNKLIQFLVTLVQPSRMTVGVKRGYQLMLHESPSKKSKVSNNNKNNSNPEGPTIHELDSELDLTPNLYDDDSPVIDSPAASVGSQQTDLNSPLQSQMLVEDTGEESTWDKPEYVTVGAVENPEDLVLTDPDLSEENLISTLDNEPTPTTTNNGTTPVDQKVFLNPSTQDTLLSNLIKNNFTVKSVDKAAKSSKVDAKILDAVAPLSPTPVTSNNMAIATRDTNVCDLIKSMPSTSDSYSSDLNTHVESTQNELEQFKDILNGYNPFVDANALLGELNKIPQNFKDVYLFNDDSPVYDLNINDVKNESLVDPSDPLVSGSELAPYGSSFDFTELLDDSIDGDNNATVCATDEVANSTINTPQILAEEPVFPPAQNVNKK
ncbi:heat shock factor protein-like isoform X2 [Zophobas morio]|uniref:heat shock factor protein-like isoform X2 n=1 Tax=Zophobas morio TaxID=2755281 RepID=UPI003083CFD3